MIGKPIPKEIKDYKEKIVFGLTARQLISTLLALGICVPVYVWGRPYLGDELASWICILTAMPAISIGYLKYNGMTFEHFLGAVIKTSLMLPTKRKYKVENFFEELEKEADKEEAMNRKKGKRSENSGKKYKRK